jgi:hypothetical protein
LFFQVSSMYSFEFNHIIPLEDLKSLQQGFFLCIWHANKIPPHIGVVIDGAYFSLKVKGKDVNIPVNEIVKLIEKKGICSVFVKIEQPIEKSDVAHVFSKFQIAQETKATCLTPITEILQVQNSVHKLSDLLNYFNAKNQISQVFGLHLDTHFNGILSYGKEEIEARLKQLSKKLN